MYDDEIVHNVDGKPSTHIQLQNMGFFGGILPGDEMMALLPWQPADWNLTVIYILFLQYIMTYGIDDKNMQDFTIFRRRIVQVQQKGIS